MTALDIQSDHLKIVQDILRKHLPKTSSVWVFGSRSKGTARKYSDLDLAIDVNQQPLPLTTLTSLLNDFEESDLPYKVDVVDWNTISSEFKQNILSHRKAMIL